MEAAVNYIQALKNQNAAMNHQMNEMQAQIREFKAHLHSTKFTGTETDGSRKDWIAVADVLRRLEDLEDLIA